MSKAYFELLIENLSEKKDLVFPKENLMNFDFLSKKRKNYFLINKKSKNTDFTEDINTDRFSIPASILSAESIGDKNKNLDISANKINNIKFEREDYIQKILRNSQKKFDDYTENLANKSDKINEKAKEFLKKIKTKNNFITLNKQIKTGIVDNSFESIFNGKEKKTIEYKSEKHEKEMKKTNNHKVNSKKNLEYSKDNLLENCFIRKNIFTNIFNDNEILSKLINFIKEKSTNFKEEKIEILNEKNIVMDFSIFANEKKNKNIKNNKKLKVFSTIDIYSIPEKFGNSNLLKLIKNSSNSYSNICSYNQEKDEIIPYYECVFTNCTKNYKTKKDWEIHYLMH